MSMLLTLCYNASMAIDLNDIADEHEFEIDDIESLYVKYSDLTITLKDGREIEHNIEYSLDAVEVHDFKRPSYISITDTANNEYKTIAESNDSYISIEDTK